MEMDFSGQLSNFSFMIFCYKNSWHIFKSRFLSKESTNNLLGLWATRAL
jgi:hypothetical protein